MKKVLILAAAALLLMCSQVTAAPCYPCDGKAVCDIQWVCPSTDQATCLPTPVCPVIFKVCDCAEADEFIEGAEVAVKMYSLTEGVYFRSDAALPNPFLYISDNQPKCETAGGAFPANIPIDDPNTLRPAWDGIDGNDVGVTKWTQFSFMDADEDSTLQSSVAADATGKYDYDQVECSVPDAAKFVEVWSVDAMGNLAGYVVDNDDGLWWTFILPGMVVDWDEAQVNRGTYAQVKIELVLVEELGICQDCTVICECLHEVFRICKEEKQQIYFPYVLNEVDQWSSGIAISNVSNSVLPNEMVAKFTIIANDGTVYTATKADFTTQVTAWLFEDLLAELGLTIPSGASVLKVTGNFIIDGYQFNLFLDGSLIFGAGVMPRLYVNDGYY